MSGGREMAHGEVSEVIPASAAEVFELLHDYGRRLSWDTLLSAAYLDDGLTEAGKGVTSVCVERRSLGSQALRTVYVSLDHPKVAALKLIDSTPLFGDWATTIRHTDLSPVSSRV